MSYVAKKRAERAPGVGKTTDVLVIDSGQGVRFLDDQTLEAFESLYQQYLENMRMAGPNLDEFIKSYQLHYVR